jgi:hypothetical protein
MSLIFKLFRNLIYGSFSSEINFCTSLPRTQVVLNHTHEQALLIYKTVVFQKLFPYCANQINRKRVTYRLLFSLPPHTKQNCICGPKQLWTSEVRFSLKRIRQIPKYKEKYAIFKLIRVSHWIPSSHFLPRPCYLKHVRLIQTLLLIEKCDSAPRVLTSSPPLLSCWYYLNTYKWIHLLSHINKCTNYVIYYLKSV